MRPLVLDVAVPDVDAAVAFYVRAFQPEVVLELPGGGAELRLRADGNVVLRVVDEASHAMSLADRHTYEKGPTPRLEMVVDDVLEWVDRAALAGATVRLRTARYAQVIDPFGHRWAFAVAD